MDIYNWQDEFHLGEIDSDNEDNDHNPQDGGKYEEEKKHSNSLDVIVEDSGSQESDD